MRFFALSLLCCLVALGLTFTSSYAYEISYPAINYRLQNPPTYCIQEPYDSSDSETLVPLADKAVKNWQDNLQEAEFKNPEYWKINSKIVPTGGTKSGCDITVYFVAGEQERQDISTVTLGKFFPSQDKIEIYYSNIDAPITFNVILHEIGHSLGLGHYIADDDEVNQKFSTSDKMSPSLMIPTMQNNPSLMKIMQVDVEKVRSIYGDRGFYGFSDLIPPEQEKPSPLPIPEPPLQPISPFKYLRITESQIIVEKYDTKTVKISGQIDEEIYHKGHPVFILIIKPDQTTEVHRLPVAGSGYFEIPISFDSTDPYGTYSVEGSYMEFTDERTNFEFSIISSMYEKYDTPSKSKPITKVTPKTDESINPSKTLDKPKKTEKKEIKKIVKKESKTVKKETKKEIKIKQSKDAKTVKIARGQTINEKISGSIPMDLYKKGKPADVTILRPDGTTEMQKITISNKGKFEHPFSITDRTPSGIYEITISYAGIQVKKFIYEIRN